MAALKRFSVFAVEDTTVQLSWGDLGPGPHQLAVGGHEVVALGHGPGTALFEGLLPSTAYEVWVDDRVARTATTLASPPGALMAKVATVSDCHLFERGFGAVQRMTEAVGVEHYAGRCLRAALAAAVEWGAELIVVKGDLTNRAEPEELEACAGLLAATGLPVIVIPGNHEVKTGALHWTPALVAIGATVVDRSAGAGFVVRDLPGLRVIGVDTTLRGHHSGTIAPTSDGILAAAVDGHRPVLLCLHHQLETARVRTHYPPGIPHSESMPFLEALSAVQPDAWVTSGHTHRCRTRTHGPIVATEVGSTKDGAGCWAGYAIHEGGVRQVVRRVTGDGTDAWLDRTRRAVGGLWGLYAPGRLERRCFTHRWINPG